MKKVFWTSVVWIVLICGFTLYMKWFNQPLAEKVGYFVVPSFNCPVLDCDCAVCSECITSCEEFSENLECPDCPDCEDVVVAECNCPAQIVTWESLELCTSVLEKLEQIEKKLSWTTEKSEEELFEEFKAWYESKK